jgi:hypothetical protein
MKERIKQLAEQAGMEDYPDRGINTLYGDKEIEKFAELIVQECIDIVQSQKVFNASYNRKEAIKQDAVLVGHDDCATDTIRKFKEHFGVEE